jgi:choline dehydrogenase
MTESSANWGETTVTRAATGTSTILAHGRGFGASPSINAMMFARSHRSSHDAWETAGAKSCASTIRSPYFLCSETTKGRNPALRGVVGPPILGLANMPNPLLACMEAAAEQGHPRAGDCGDGLGEGFGWPSLNIVENKRQSAADAYLTPAVRDRGNLGTRAMQTAGATTGRPSKSTSGAPSHKIANPAEYAALSGNHQPL